ncbi:MAG: DUF2027 domain-containing protein [Thermoflexibacter sp.]
MHVGDRVRLLHHREEGIITNFLPNNMIEVEIEDGFRIPVLKNEVTLIATEETIVFRDTKSKLNDRNAAHEKIIGEVGFFLVFIPINDKQLTVNLVNNTEIDILFTIGEIKDNNYSGLAAGHLRKKTWQKVDEANLDRFEKWSPLLIQALIFRAGFGSIKEPLIRKIVFNAGTFFKSKMTSPLLNKEGYVFQIDQKIVSIEPDKIKESMLSANEPALPTKPKVMEKIVLPPKVRKKEIDLHIEKLTDKSDKMNASEMLNLQLDVFEKALDSAIFENVEEVIFIHGVGNGTLRTEIQRRLSKHKNVAYFQDAQKEKFGYGATLAKLK